MMHRRRFIGVMAAGSLAAPAAHGAPPGGKVPVIGVLMRGAASAPGQANPLLDAFLAGLRDLGYGDGRNVALDVRWAEGADERLPGLAGDLVRRGVSVMLVQGTPSLLAAKGATRTVPVVMVQVGDPVALGVATTLAHPGSNFTGLSNFDTKLDGKRIELLREAVPGLSRVAVLWSANDTGMTLAVSRVEIAARNLGLAVESLPVRESDAIAAAFEKAQLARSQGLIVTAQPFTQRNQARILDLAAKYRIPAIYTLRSFVDAGGLMAYSSSVPDSFRQAAGYVAKILAGADPADLPIELPTKFELVVNLKAAKELNLTIPQSLLVRADDVIQ